MSGFAHLNLAIDVVVVVLLVAVIGYAVRLNRNLASLRANKAELERLVASFNDATARAEAGVARLKTSAAETASTLNENVAKARELRDDLIFMTSRADDLADRLEAAIAAARPDAARRERATPSQAAGARGPAMDAAPTGEPKPTAGDAAPGRADTDPPEAAARGKTKSDLLRALQGMR